MKFKYELFLISITLVFILLLNISLNLYEQNNLCNDCENYFESIFYLYQKFEVHYYRPIGIALIYGTPILFGINSYNELYPFIFFFNIIFYLGFILTFFQLCKIYFEEKISFIISLILILFFGINLHLFELLSEIPFLFFVLLAFYYLCKYIKFNNSKLLYISISLFLFGILIRPGILYFSLLMLVYFIPKLYKSYSFRNSIPLLVVIFLIFFQLIKMKKQYGDYTISYIDSVTYYNYLGSKAICFKNNQVLNQNTNKRATYIFNHSFHNQKKIAYEDLFNQIRYNTFNLMRAFVDDIGENTKTSTSYISFLKNNKNDINYDKKIKLISEITEWQNKLTTLLGFLLTFYFFYNRHKQNEIILIFASYYLYIFLISGVSSTQGDRFHIVFYPIVILKFAIFLKNKMTIST